MLIGLYDGVLGSSTSHHKLPLWHKPEQPNLIFNPETMKDLRHLKDGDLLLQDTVFWAMLLGLHNMNITNAMAHMSLPVDIDQQKFGGQKRLWVQITTLPQQNDAQGIPLVVSGLDSSGKPKVLVESLWGIDYKEEAQDAPYASKDPDVWAAYFTRKIAEARAELEKEINKVQMQLVSMHEHLNEYPLPPVAVAK